MSKIKSTKQFKEQVDAAFATMQTRDEAKACVRRLNRRCAALSGPSALSGPAGLSSELRSEATLNHLKGEARFKGGEAADLKAEGRLNPLEGVARNPWGFTLWIPGDLTPKSLGV